MTLDRARLKALCDAATPGPWTIVERFGITAPGFQGYEPNSWALLARVDDGESCRGDQDAAFIAAARTALPELLAELEQVEAQLVEAKEAIRGLRAENVVATTGWGEQLHRAEALEARHRALMEAGRKVLADAEELADLLFLTPSEIERQAAYNERAKEFRALLSGEGA